jgi:aromatic-L-amino-acid decarboxylase
VHESGIWGDALAALYNPQLAASWHAPAAQEIEHHTLEFLARVIGYDAKVAHFTTGGSEANLTALLAATSAVFPHVVDTGAGIAAAHGAVYVSTQAHHSIHKAMRVAGLGNRALRQVPCNREHQMDVSALRQMIDLDASAGRTPIMIVATLGTTTAGAVDDLDAIAKVARANSAWLHVDAAWGGAAGFAPALRGLFRDIGTADSVTWDAHKWLSVPMGAAMFFCRRPDALRSVFHVETGYIPEGHESSEDPYLSSLQWSRRFIGLKVFLTLASQGQSVIAARLEHQLSVAAYLRDRLMDSGWKILNRTPLPVVCFTHGRLTTRGLVSAIADELASAGRAWVSEALLPEGPVLRACITNDETSKEDADLLCEELDRALRQIC